MANNTNPIVPYPPCHSSYCRGPVCLLCSEPDCCSLPYGGGSKYEWPELVGVDGQKAKEVIESQYKVVTVEFVPIKGRITFGDFCCNRIYVYLDANNKVLRPPIIG